MPSQLCIHNMHTEGGDSGIIDNYDYLCVTIFFTDASSQQRKMTGCLWTRRSAVTEILPWKEFPASLSCTYTTLQTTLSLLSV